MKQDKEHPFENENEAREKYFVDVDRMINEGLGGGTVSPRANSGRIEGFRDFEKEEPPYKVNNKER